MEYLSSSSSFDPSCLLNDIEILQPPSPCALPTQLVLEPQSDQIIQPSQPDDDDELLDHLLAQTPCFLEQDDLQLLHHHQQQQQEEDDDAINRGQRRKSPPLELNDGNAPLDQSKEKKKQRIVHREVERQRRFEMSSLHASLRSLLPLDYVKGKRSMSDHIDMASKYIQHLQEKIKVLSDQRDALKSERCNSKACDYQVSVNPWNNGGVEVIVCTTTSCGGCYDQGLPLSRVLQFLIKQGLDVVSCTSNKGNNKLVHSIQAQVLHHICA
ncbi:hypothetical protein Cgig2_002467 [Carnegiea gigantea]|uniref:BHLH domain-containing protein n=1 Tax=Carnegiea gigantea TaxID=171969 RepID=A0A9Q1KUI9_9CARY|nr:hypothetical protein Cgig2_002467 [Carnegiea gigantea]